MSVISSGELCQCLIIPAVRKLKPHLVSRLVLSSVQISAVEYACASTDGKNSLLSDIFSMYKYLKCKI